VPVLETLLCVDFLACRVAPARIIRVNMEATTSLTRGGTWSSESMAEAGVIVTISRKGDVEIIRGLVRETDRKARTAGRKAQRPASASEQTAADALASHVNRSRPEHGESLTRRLAAHRTAALQVLLSKNPQVARAALATPFVARVFGNDRGYVTTALQVVPSLPAHALLSAADDLKASRAWQALEAAQETWRARLPQERGAWFSWLTELPPAELSELLALYWAGHGGLVGADCRGLPVPRLQGADRSGAERGGDRSE